MVAKIPLNGAGITLEQYQKYTMIADDEDKEFVGHKTLNIFLDIPMNEVRSIPQAQAEELIKDITDSMDEMPPLDYTFEFNGTTYGFIPDLEELTLGEYIDLEEYLVKPAEWHKAAAVLFRPVKDKVGKMYNIEPYRGSKGDHQIMKSLPASQFVNATLFFYRLSSHLLVHSAIYLEKLSKRMKEKGSLTSHLRDSLAKGGDGSGRYTRLAEVMRQTLEKVLK